MTYEEFLKFVPANCAYETIYNDRDGSEVLVISMLDAYSMLNKVREQATPMQWPEKEPTEPEGTNDDYYREGWNDCLDACKADFEGLLKGMRT